jgi:response regulator RpfG family c-di-GMP phosphodiesterase
LKKLVLTIDDDGDIIEAIRSVLEMEGYEIISAKNGKQALELLSKLPDNGLPDLILLDYEMPILNGSEFNRDRLLEPRLAHIPVVLMTAALDIKKIMDKLDVEAYLQKPMGIDSIIKVANNFVKRRESAKFSFLT